MQRKIHLTLAVVASTLVFWGCDTTAVFSPSYVQFDQSPFQILGAQPIRDTGSGFVPACRRGETPDGFKVSFVLKSSKNKGKFSGNKDQLVREGDRLNKTIISVGPGRIFSADNFSFTNSNNSTNALGMNSFSGLGNGRPAADASAVDLRFVERNNSRSESVAVALLIDHSGSMRGAVDPTRLFETKGAGLPVPEASTDGTATRFPSAGLGLISKLNDNDQVIAWTFNESGVRLLCDLDDPTLNSVNDEPIEAAERACFEGPLSAYYDVQTASGKLATTTNLDANGRTPLWYAVDRAWNFLQLNAANKAKHIIVLTDSPDTCYGGGDWWTAEDADCSLSKDVTYTTFKNVVETAIATATPVIPISFLQLQSEAYPATDPAQMEISCLTNGSYRFINNSDFQDADATENITGDLPRVLENAFTDIRYSISGVWELDVRSPSVQDVNPGQIASYTGSISLSVPDIIDETVIFAEAEKTGDEDTRLLVRTTCSADTDCPGGDALGTCETGCLDEGHACVHPDQQPLTTNDTCCCGVPVDEPYITQLDGTEIESLSAQPQWQCSYYTETCCTPVAPNDKKFIDGCKYANGSQN